MSNLVLGNFEDSGEAVALDLEALIGTHLCIQANSGGGKSGTIRRLLEITHGKLQHIVLDVEDEFYTLREKYEYMIAGGDNGDCAATVNNAEKLALMILRTGFSAIVQINSLSMDDRREFIGRFLSALIAAPKDLWRPALVILDEAQSYAPQVGKVESSDGVLQLMTLGRKRGFTGVLATPRAASIHKDVTGPVNNWLMGRVGQPADRRAVADALGFSANSPEARGLQKLIRREFWAFGPALCTEPRKMKVGAIETTAIKAGQAAVPTPPAPAAMKRILAELNAAASVADEASSDPRGTPPSGGSSGQPAAPDKQALAEEYRRGFGEGEISGRATGHEEGAAMVRGAAKEAFTVANDLLGQVSALIEDQLRLIETNQITVSGNSPRLLSANEVRGEANITVTVEPTGKLSSLIARERAPRPPADPDAMPGLAKKILAAIDFKPTRAFSWTQIAMITPPGYSESGGQFRRAKKWLIDTGAVVEVGNGAKIAKPTGRTVAPTGNDLVQCWAGKLPGVGAAILQCMWKGSKTARPRSLAAIGSELGYQVSGGQFRRGVKALRDASIVEASGDTINFSAAFLELANNG